MGKHWLHFISPREELQKALIKEGSLSKHTVLCSHIFGIFQYNKGEGGLPGLELLGTMER